MVDNNTTSTLIIPAPAITEIEGTKQLTMVSNRDLPKSLRDFF